MDFKNGGTIKSLLSNLYLTDIVQQICQMPAPDTRISAMHHLLTLIKTEGASAIKVLCERYAPNYQFSIANGRYLILNSELLTELLKLDPTCGVLEALRSGVDAYDTRTLQAVELADADPAHCIIQIKTEVQLVKM